MLRVYAQLLGSVVLWGGTWVSGRLLAQSMPSFCAAFLRFVVASVFLVGWTWWRTGAIPKPPRHWGLVALLGATGIFAYNYFFFTGLASVPAGRAALIIATAPLVITLASPQGWRPQVIGGALVALAGAGTVLAHGAPWRLFATGLTAGDLHILGCVASWSAYSILNVRATRRMEPLTAVTWACVAGTVFLALPALHSGVVEHARTATLLDWGNIVFLGVLATGVAFTWYVRGIQAVGAPRAGVFINLVPVCAVLLAWMLLGEPIDSSLVVGGILVLCGVRLANRH
ncbi:MAG: DMT family transporter [Desulfomicrobiaceae bacterium]|jgi:drug/metabolite transporter (DMT)-like permease